jgi:hypothetical protein
MLISFPFPRLARHMWVLFGKGLWLSLAHKIFSLVSRQRPHHTYLQFLPGASLRVVLGSASVKPQAALQCTCGSLVESNNHTTIKDKLMVLDLWPSACFISEELCREYQSRLKSRPQVVLALSIFGCEVSCSRVNVR